jgi:hypothetical protein
LPPELEIKLIKGAMMKTQNFFQSALVLSVLMILFVYGCDSDSMVGRLWGQMGELFAIKEAIDDTLIEGETSIRIENGKRVTLGLVNTEFNDVEAPEREKAADNVLEILLEKIAAKEEFKNVDTVIVNFIHYEKKFLVVDVTMTIDYYIYNI